jgi:Insertion element 4 transposase N-terminal/Transposase DDE domain
MSILRQSPAFAKSVAATSVATLIEVIPPEVVSQAIERSQTRSKRRRKLPAELMAVALVVLGLFAGGTLRDAVRKTLQGLRLRADFALGESAGKGGICKARYRYGPRLLRELFTLVCQPLATPNTPGAFLFGRRLLALDGTLEAVADTPANAKAFGRWKGPRGPSAYPLLKGIYLEECGTHAVVGAIVRPCTASEQGAGRVLLKQVGPDSLLLLDSAHCCYQTIAQAQTQGVHVLTRAKGNLTLKPLQMLADGTYLAHLSPSNTKALRGKGGKLPPLLVRVIRYDAPDPKNPERRIVHRLVTTLLDPTLYPAMTLIATYHERWEIENAIDEVDTHLRAARPILTSKKPAGVVQEVYGILLAHYAVRKVIFEAAQQAAVDPDRVSFVGALRLIRDALPELDAALSEQTRARRYAVLLEDVGKELNPPRRCRSYPRVVKRKMSKFKLKRPTVHGPQLKTTPFLETVRIC